jgi:hypothetical protein
MIAPSIYYARAMTPITLAELAETSLVKHAAGPAFGPRLWGCQAVARRRCAGLECWPRQGRPTNCHCRGDHLLAHGPGTHNDETESRK